MVARREIAGCGVVEAQGEGEGVAGILDVEGECGVAAPVLLAGEQAHAGPCAGADVHEHGIRAARGPRGGARDGGTGQVAVDLGGAPDAEFVRGFKIPEEGEVPRAPDDPAEFPPRGTQCDEGAGQRRAADEERSQCAGAAAPAAAHGDGEGDAEHAVDEVDEAAAAAGVGLDDLGGRGERGGCDACGDGAPRACEEAGGVQVVEEDGDGGEEGDVDGVHEALCEFAVHLAGRGHEHRKQEDRAARRGPARARRRGHAPAGVCSAASMPARIFAPTASHV